MSNLKSHAVKCFGQDAVEAAFEKTQSRGHDGSIFSVFTCQGQQPVKISHCCYEQGPKAFLFDRPQ
jgi:hypothetical protein